MSTFDTSKLEALKSRWLAAGNLSKEAHKAESAAREEYTSEVLRLGELGYGAPAPLGSVLYEWTNIYGGRSLGPPRKTGRYGSLEFVTRESRKTLAANKTVTPGLWIIRLRNANGELGKAFVEVRRNSIGFNWCLEGETPQKADLKL